MKELADFLRNPSLLPKHPPTCERPPLRSYKGRGGRGNPLSAAIAADWKGAAR
jgi:hypothetical protein